ncbi:MAG: hypothetical protein CMO26_15085 [Thiotrichales bacterium]|nr:hypothetical protein [Thiotrichales bacterium]
MTLFLNNVDQQRCISVADALSGMEAGMRQMSRGDAIRRPRIDNFLPTSREDEFFCFSSMEGGIREPGYYALRIKPDILYWKQHADGQRRENHSVEPGSYGGLVLLYRVENAELLAIMNDGHVQHVRVAATAGLGMKYLSREDSTVVGMLGSGGMARTFAEAACAVRGIERIHAYSPNHRNLSRYCEDMAASLPCQVVAASSAEEVAGVADILCCCTNAMQPVVQGSWIKPGTHITSVALWEIGDDTRDRIDTVGELVQRSRFRVRGFSDDDFELRMDNVMSYAAGDVDERARIPRGEIRDSWYPNAKLVACCDWSTNRPYSRDVQEITMLANMEYGIIEGEASSSSGTQGLQFACTGGQIYERAVELGIGQELPTEMFLQDIAT